MILKSVTNKMKFSTSKNELQSALQKLSKATPSRSTLPILNSVLISVSENETNIKSTDLEITVIVKLPASIESVGSVAAPLQMLSNITNELPDETRVSFDVDGENKISISTEYGNYDIVGKPAEEFPNTPTIETENVIEIEAGVLKDIINKTVFAVSRDDLKPALTGVLFKFLNNNLVAVATDGHRLVKYERTNNENTNDFGDIIVPKKFLNLVMGGLSDGNIKLSIGENHLTTIIGEDQYFTRIIDEKFPDFDGVIPKDNDKNFVVNKKTLLSAVKRVSIFSNKSTHQIALNLNNESALISTEDPEQSTKAKENIKGEYSGEDITVGYNAAYLKDVLSHVDDDDVVVKLKSPISAALFLPKKQKDNTNLTMLLMPIRLND
tara:strand:- start:601 stop:1743 length:1143 start_codon:yes stop_codon:yes gene_type:complete